MLRKLINFLRNKTTFFECTVNAGPHAAIIEGKHSTSSSKMLLCVYTIKKKILHVKYSGSFALFIIWDFVPEEILILCLPGLKENLYSKSLNEQKMDLGFAGLLEGEEC